MEQRATCTDAHGLAVLNHRTKHSARHRWKQELLEKLYSSGIICCTRSNEIGVSRRHCYGTKVVNVDGLAGRLNESHCIKADGSRGCRTSQISLFYRPGNVANSFSMPLSPLSMQPSTTSLPPFSAPPPSFFVPPSSTIPFSPPPDGSPYFSLYPHFGLRTFGLRLLLLSPRPSIFIYSPTPPTPTCPFLSAFLSLFLSLSFRDRLSVALPAQVFALPLSAQLFNLPRADAARLGATSPLSYPSPSPRARCSSFLVRNYPIRAIRPHEGPGDRLDLNPFHPGNGFSLESRPFNVSGRLFAQRLCPGHSARVHRHSVAGGSVARFIRKEGTGAEARLARISSSTPRHCAPAPY